MRTFHVSAVVCWRDSVASVRLSAKSSAAARLCVACDAVSVTHMLPPSMAFFFLQHSVSDFPVLLAEAFAGGRGFNVAWRQAAGGIMGACVREWQDGCLTFEVGKEAEESWAAQDVKDLSLTMMLKNDSSYVSFYLDITFVLFFKNPLLISARSRKCKGTHFKCPICSTT